MREKGAGKAEDHGDEIHDETHEQDLVARQVDETFNDGAYPHSLAFVRDRCGSVSGFVLARFEARQSDDGKKRGQQEKDVGKI